MSRKKGWFWLVGIVWIVSGCAFHTTAKDWNGLKGFDGKPAYYKKTTKVGFNLLVMVPFLGNVGVDGMVRDLTEDIKEENGDYVRIVQGASENYWHGFPPFTWVVTPVVTTVSAEYSPDMADYEKDQEKIRNEVQNSSSLNPMNW